MALNLPQPASFFTRLASATNTLLGRGPAEAPPVGVDPVANSSPVEEGAPAKTGQVYSRAYGGFSIDPQWLSQLALNQDTVLQKDGGGDLKLFDAILDDPTCASAFQQRRLAVVSKPWEVEAGDESAKAKEAAEHLREQLKHVAWDRICDLMLFARWYGYSVGEALFDYGPDGKIWLTNVLVPDRRWFAFTNAGELQMRSAEKTQEAVPPNKFWVIKAGGSHDFVHYGTGLAHWCYWPVWFKKNVIKFWAIYLEKFGMPTALGKFPVGAGDDVRNNVLEAAAAVGRDAAVTIPEDVTLELMAQGRSSDGSYLQFCSQMDDALLRVILSQTGTSKSEAQGLGGSQAPVMKDVRDEIVASDSDLLHESFNGTIARWLTLWNFGPDVAPPRVYRNLEPEEDLNQSADLDAKLDKLGWRRTADSFLETYGEGYEEKPDTPIDPATGLPMLPGQQPAPGKPGDVPPEKGQKDGGDPNVIDMATERRKRAAQFAAFASGPRPLYVSRQLEPDSGRKLLAWARDLGLPNLEPLDQLHVTVLYSRQAVDWFEMGTDWQSDPQGRLRILPGGPRSIERLGDDCIVLRFVSSDLKWRHDSMVERGASHDYDDYRPHITIATDAEFDVESITEAFQGELVFGPELFEDLQTDDPVLETAFSAEELDHIDRWAAALAREAEPMVAEFAASLKGKLDGITTPEALRVVLLDALERFPAERLGELSGLSYTAARAAAAAGETDALAL
jgi:hypothetical protein